MQKSPQTRTSERHCGPTKSDIFKAFMRCITAKICARGNWLTHEQYRVAARQTAKIDFGCDFVNGKCKEQRSKPRSKWEEGDWRRGEMACCSQCASTRGYLAGIPAGSVEYYMRRFNLRTGFWRAGKGCILPRERRSPTCLTFNCMHSNAMSDTLDKLFQIAAAPKIEVQSIAGGAPNA